MINRQLSKQDIRWPVSPDHTACSNVDPSRSSTFLKLSADKLPVSNDRRLKSIFPIIHVKYVVFMSLWPFIVKILISNWPQTRNSASFLKIQAEKTFSYHGHALVTLYVQFLYSDWSKFGRWVHEENLCSVLKVVYFDFWNWQSFVSTCDVFNCLFPLDVQTEIQLLSRVFCYPWLVCFFGFLAEKCVACQNWVFRFRMASFSFFTLLNA